MTQRVLELTTAPFLREGTSTRRIMFEVVFALVPVIGVATWIFGASALLLLASTTAGAVLTEWLVMPRRTALGTLRDGSGLLTGLLLGLTLPPAMPLWMGFLGGVFGMGLGKLIWGGLGRNVFNPALLGRAFLQAAFPGAATTWTAPGQGFFDLPSSTLAAPLMSSGVDVVSTATPLGLAKFEAQVTQLEPLFFGNVAGSLGETSAVLLLALGIWLAVRRVFDWRLMVSTLLTVVVFAGALHLISPDSYPGPLFMVCSGGLMFGAVFMVTDPVTTPITPRGAWIFGLGVGVLVVLLRLFGGLPESVMYAILLMNAVTPLIEQRTQPRRFGG
jgi:Na+-translocating ferredoxin:NAD+ oxidoreductase subunit D